VVATRDSAFKNANYKLLERAAAPLPTLSWDFPHHRDQWYRSQAARTDRRDFEDVGVS